MAEHATTLVGRTLAQAVAALDAEPGRAGAWDDARRALALLRDENPALAAAVEGEDLEALRAVVDGWYARDHGLPEQDRNILKRAMKAYRKRLKLTVLDAESTVGGGPMSAGRSADIVAITPPDHYARDVWDELVRLERLVDAGQGMYELGPKS